MKTVLTLFAIATLCATGAEKIEGAFGKKLGEFFEPTNAVGTSKLTDGTPLYQFAPSNSFRSFNRYYALITPTTKRIYCIWATGPVANTEAGKKEQALLMEILQEKYGSKQKEGIFDAMGDVLRIDQGRRDVLTKLTGFTDVTIDIRYYDRDLEKEAERERLKIEAAKVDKSGL